MSKAIKAGQGEYYLSLAATDDYYLSGNEPPGYWLGEGAAALGLEGEVEKEHFRNLLRGRDASGIRKLVRNADIERRAGWDLTWSAPKSVSVAWSQADFVIREQIEACIRRAVAAGVSYLESVGAVSRQGEDGRIHALARLCFAAFLHSTSRALDPQLHVHTILLNVGVRADGSTGTLEPRALYRHQMAAGSLFRAELALALETELGFRARREGRAFEILGVDTELITFFSKRRAQIEAELARLGHSGAKAAEIANFATRPHKTAIPREELFLQWQQVGREHHWSTKQLSWLVQAPFKPRNLESERSSASVEALEHLTKTESHFCRRQIVQAVAECCQGRGLGADTVFPLCEKILGSQELVPLCEIKGEFHFTTKEILALERRVVETAEAMQTKGEFLSPIPIDRAIERHPELSEEQREALRHVCFTKGGVSIIQGLAGTGKSTLFAIAREVWEQQDLSIQGAALSGKAARGLSEATGIASTTVHRFLSEIESGVRTMSSNSVLVIDEASMIGTRQLAKVVDHCSRAGASLVLCGDSRQLQAIELGGLFTELSNRLKASPLTEIQRQREDWAKEAVKDFAYGRADRALLPYQTRGFLSETGHPVTAIDRLLADWIREGLPDLKTCVMLAGTTIDVIELNRRAQDERQNLGQLGSSGVKLGPDVIFPGDRVIFTRNSLSLGVFNGDLGTTSHVQGKVLSIDLDDDRTIKVDLDLYSHVRLGYALSTHKAQGMTVERSFVLTGDSMTDRELTYVQASRARSTTRWYVGHDLEGVTERMSRSHEKLAALSLMAGPELELTLAR